MPKYEKDVANVNKIKEYQMAFKLFNLLLNFNITAHLQVHNTVPYFNSTSKSDTKEKIQSIPINGPIYWLNIILDCFSA